MVSVSISTLFVAISLLSEVIMNWKLLLATIAAALAIHGLQCRAQDSCTRPRLISVTGTAEMNVPPDQVVLTVAVQTRDRDLTIAKSQQDSRAKKVLAEARDAGIEAK